MSARSHHGVVVAPAGHGKTHRVSEILASGVRCLVLTHTNVASAHVRDRADSHRGVRIETIDSLAKRLTESFPRIACLAEDPSWKEVRHGALKVLERPSIGQALLASYDQVLVDEFQDCCASQVLLIQRLAEIIPTLVLGDPMQSIFDALDRQEQALTWETKTQALPPLGTLATPWRWRNSPSHGQWVVNARTSLATGRTVALDATTTKLVTVPDQQGAFLSSLLAPMEGTVAIISGNASRPDKLGRIAKMHRWSNVEVVELARPKELETFANDWDTGKGLAAVLRLAKDCCSNCDKVPGYGTCLKNATAGQATRSRSELGKMVRDFPSNPTELGLRILRHIADNPQTGTYRPDLLSRARRCLLILANDPESSMRQALESVHGRIRAGATHRQRGPAVGTVLRLKGLEFDHVVIVDEHDINRPEEVYVAVSRARYTVTVVRTVDTPLRWFISARSLTGNQASACSVKSSAPAEVALRTDSSHGQLPLQ